MGILDSIGNSAVEAITGTSSGTTLQDFLSQFSSSDGVWSKTIDPYSTFDVKIKFYPSYYDKPVKDKKKKDEEWKDKLGKLGDSLVSSAKSAVKNLANNVTGGLLGSFMNSKVDIMDKHNNNSDALYGDTTFMEYLAAANLIVGKDDGWIGEGVGQAVQPLELQLGPYCQEITIPNLEVPVGGSSQNAFGEFPINGMFVKPDTHVLMLKIVNTKVPLHERIFYPWMREVTLNTWSYWQQPYTTATITIDFTKHNDIKYVFCGCRPQRIITQQATQKLESSNLTRDVSFLFDYMFITSNLKNCESLTEKLLSTGKSLVSSAANMVKF